MRDASLPSSAAVVSLDSLAMQLEKTNGVARSAEQPKLAEPDAAPQVSIFTILERANGLFRKLVGLV